MTKSFVIAETACSHDRSVDQAGVKLDGAAVARARTRGY